MKYQIKDIEKIYPNWYSAESEMSKEDQMWMWENLELPEEDEQRLKQLTNTIIPNDNVLMESANGTCKFDTKAESIWYKSEFISKLKTSTSETYEKDIASYLAQIFKYWESVDGHWLFISRIYTVRTLNWVMDATVKKYLRGAITTNPPQYFTFLLKFRKERKSYRGYNKKYITEYLKKHSGRAPIF